MLLHHISARWSWLHYHQCNDGIFETIFWWSTDIDWPIAVKKRQFSPPQFLSMENTEKQSFQTHFRKYRSTEAKNNNENMMYYTGTPKKSSKIYFNFNP